jgi:parvulin-like peptidyl-prolyl isomerase
MAIRVNGETVDDALIRQEAASLRPRMAEAMPGEDPVTFETKVKEWARENVIERVLLRQAAIADPEPIPAGDLERTISEIRAHAPEQSSGFPTADDDLRREVETQLRVDRLLERITAKVSPPRNKDVVDYYMKHKDLFAAPETVHAAHIVKSVGEKTDEATALAAIREAEAEIKAGAPFAEVADRRSDCPGRGGDLGWFPRGQMVDEFEAAVFPLVPGALSEVFRSPFGFHLALMHEHRPAGVRPLEEVRDGIEETLYAQKRQRLIEQYLDKLRAKAEISTAGQG